MVRLLFSNVIGYGMTVASNSVLNCLCACSKKTKICRVKYSAFLVVFGNNFGKMDVTLYIDGGVYKI